MSNWKPSESLIHAEHVVAQLEDEAVRAGSTITPVFRHRMVEVISAHLHNFSTRVHDAPTPNAGQKVWTQVQPNGVTTGEDNTHTFTHAAADDPIHGQAAALNAALDGPDSPVIGEALQAALSGKKGKRGPKAKGKKAGKRGRTAALDA